MEKIKNLKKTDSVRCPLVSIVTVVYNNVGLLERTIKSVLNQTYGNIEYIIIDGGSTDGTVEIIKKYSDNVDYWVSEKDDGIYDAMNKGIRISSGSIVGIINSDDWYERDVVGNIVEQFSANPEIDITYGEEIFYFSIWGKMYARKDIYKQIVEDDILVANYIGHPTVFVKKSVYNVVGMYDKSLKICADWDFFIRAYKNKCKFLFVPYVIAHCLEGGISSTTYKQCKKEIVKIKKKYGTYIGSDSIRYFMAGVKEMLYKVQLGRVLRNFSKSQKYILGKYNIVKFDYDLFE